AAPRRAGRPRADLAAEQRRLGAALAASLPPDQTAARREIADERRWRADTARGPDPAVEERSAQVERRAATRDRWIAGNAEDLARWDGLGQAVEDREDLLTHALEVSPGDERCRSLGSLPDSPPGRTARSRQIRRLAIDTEVDTGRTVPEARRPAPEAGRETPERDAGWDLGWQ
ncbi:MAG: hypothetical protein M3137_09195, partial [Actinomycetota bacterium]|nr:hypothetical protein [Actinomycetota bacterium]